MTTDEQNKTIITGCLMIIGVLCVVILAALAVWVWRFALG